MDALFGPVVPRPRSRIHGPRRVLQELRRIRVKTGRALEHRKLTDEESCWLRRVYDTLDNEIVLGESVLPGHDRIDRKVRKRKPSTIKI
jgi:hypothetical protein